MKTILAMAGASLLALSASAYAQNAGSPGATGTGGSLTGSNTGTSGPNSYQGNNYGDRQGHDVYLNEGRAAAPDAGYDGPGVNHEERSDMDRPYPQRRLSGAIDGE